MTVFLFFSSKLRGVSSDPENPKLKLHHTSYGIKFHYITSIDQQLMHLLTTLKTYFISHNKLLHAQVFWAKLCKNTWKQVDTKLITCGCGHWVIKQKSTFNVEYKIDLPSKKVLLSRNPIWKTVCVLISSQTSLVLASSPLQLLDFMV